MSPDDKRVLREAATSMRELHPISHPRHEMWGHIAQWLENVARWEVDEITQEDALCVARSYLSSVGRPDITSDV